VTIPGFYDDVIEFSNEQRKDLSAQSPNDADFLAETGSPATTGEAGFTNIERRTIRPTLDVNGLVGGYTGEGSATIIPAKASAKISMRMVPNQDPAKISQAFDQAVKQACPDTVRLEIQGEVGCPAYQAPTDSAVTRAAFRALEAAFGKSPALTREGGTLPILPMFKQVLGADSLMLGFAMPDCNFHGPNEFFHVSDFETGTQCILRLIDEIGYLDT
jgi:acetylornithine deacetylase/succinyl-diaminopimelate desuccinylase-like protein